MQPIAGKCIERWETYSWRAYPWTYDSWDKILNNIISKSETYFRKSGPPVLLIWCIRERWPPLERAENKGRGLALPASGPLNPPGSLTSNWIFFHIIPQNLLINLSHRLPRSMSDEQFRPTALLTLFSAEKRILHVAKHDFRRCVHDRVAHEVSTCSSSESRSGG